MASFGERLKREREMRNVSLEEIAESTKIGKRNLLALETEEFNKLPGGIFNKGFVRAYAKYLGLDEDQAVTDFLAAENAASTGIRLAVDPVPAVDTGTNGDAAKKSRKERSRELEAIAARREADKRKNPPLNPSNTSNKIWVAFAVICLAAALVGWWRYSHPAREAAGSQPRAAVAAHAAAPLPVAPATAPATASASADPPVAAPEYDGLAHLKVRAIQDSWIQVKADGKVVLDGTLDAATEKSFSAKELIFKTGNAGGVEVTYNGKTEAPFGKDKQVKEIKIKPEKKPVT
jgi:cytoskeleton protein RodZ